MTSMLPTFEPSGALALAWLRQPSSGGHASAGGGPSAAGGGVPARRRQPAFWPAAQASEAFEAWAQGGAEREAFEARALAGDSAAARGLAMVHAVALELGGQAARPAGERGRRRLLAAVQALPVSPFGGPPVRSSAWSAEDVPPVVAVGLRHAAVEPGSLEAGSLEAGSLEAGRRSEALRSSERARVDAIARLAADVRGGDARLEQVLDRLAAVADFPLLVVSVVHGGETIHRAFRSRLPIPVPRAVPREASFCTHCVADEAPLVISNAHNDPFFCRHPAVAAFGLVAYVGVPLRLPSGEVIGTLCGYDVRPRHLRVEDVALLEVFARRCGEVLAGASDSAHLDAASSAEAGVDVYGPGLFEDLLDVVRMRVAVGAPPGGAALLVGPALGLVPDPGCAGVLAGKLSDGRAAWLVVGEDVSTRAGVAAAALRGRISAPVRLAILTGGSAVASLAGWAASVA